MKKYLTLPITVSALVVFTAVFLYVRYWNIATVDGQGISRLSYYQTLDKQSGKQILAQMVQEKVILKQAADNKVVISQSDIDASVASIEAQVKAQGQTLDDALTTAGMTRSDLQKQIRLQKIEEKLSNPQINISQADVDAFLKANKDQLPTTYTKDQLQTLAKAQLTNQAVKDAASAWLTKVQQSAKVIYQ